MAEGFVLFHRKIEEWEWYTEPNVFRLFFHLVLKANHKDYMWRGHEIKRGQIITSSEHLSLELKMGRQKIRTALKKLNGKELTIKSTNQFTLITIENYAFYQDKKEKVTNVLTNKQPTDNQRITTNNNDNNDNNEKEIYTADFENFYKSYCNPSDKARTFTNWKKVIKEISISDLMVSAENYAHAVSDREQQYKKSSANFLGKEKFYKDYVKERYTPISKGLSERQKATEKAMKGLL